jgi:hypothetical protein
LVLLNPQQTTNSLTPSFGIYLIAPPTSSPSVARVSGESRKNRDHEVLVKFH